MRLISLKLQNFRQHENSEIEFSNGITIINGFNGSGKSTILEAITWAIYGSDAARGTKDSIKFNKAKPRTKVKAELTFQLDFDTYKVVRSLDKAEVFLNNIESPVTVGQNETIAYLIDKIGMTKNEFFNTYFTGQKELNFLGNQKPIERKKFISKVLNYEKVRSAQDQIRIDKNGLSNEILGIKQGLIDFESIENDKILYEKQLSESKNSLNNKTTIFSKLSIEVSNLEPQWETFKSKKINYDQYISNLGFIEEKTAYLSKNIQNLETQYSKIQDSVNKYNELQHFEDKFKIIKVQIAQHQKLQEFETQKININNRIESLNKEITEKEKQLESIVESGKAKKSSVEKIPALKEKINALNKKINEEDKKWNNSKKEKELLIQHQQKEIDKIKKQLKVILEKGEDGDCPTCYRPLHDDFNHVTSNFNQQIDAISKEIGKIEKELVEIQLEPEIIQKSIKEKQLIENEYDKFIHIQGQYDEEKNR